MMTNRYLRDMKAAKLNASFFNFQNCIGIDYVPNSFYSNVNKIERKKKRKETLYSHANSDFTFF